MVEKKSDAGLALGESGDESHLAARLLYLIAAMSLLSWFSLQTMKGSLQSPRITVQANPGKYPWGWSDNDCSHADAQRWEKGTA